VACAYGDGDIDPRTGGIGRNIMHWRNNFSISEVDELFRAGALFTARGFSRATIKALVLGGIDAPERLLFMGEADVQSISVLNEEALEEIARYRAQFVATQRKQTWRALNVPSAAQRLQPGLPTAARAVSLRRAR
jgi:hypothetical protein